MDNLFTLRIRKDKVVRTIMNAGVLAMGLVLFTLLWHLLTLGFVSGSLATIGTFIGVLVFLILGVGILLKSRIAAVMLVVVYGIERVFNLIYYSISGNESLAAISTVIGVFFFMVFLRGAKATMVYHRHLKR